MSETVDHAIGHGEQHLWLAAGQTKDRPGKRLRRKIYVACKPGATMPESYALQTENAASNAAGWPWTHGFQVLSSQL